MLVMIVLISVSCKKDEEKNPPSIRLMDESGYVHSDTLLASGEDIRLKVLMQKGDLNITNFLIEVFSDTVSRYVDTAMNTDYLLWEGTFLKTLAEIEEWHFTVRDRDGNSASAALIIGLDTGSQYGALLAHPAAVFGAQGNQLVAGCYDTGEQEMYFHQEVAADTSLQSLVDILYFYDEGDKNTIASPGANIADGIFPVNPGDWTYSNTTRYIKTSLTDDDFEAAENDSILLANYDEGSAKRKAKNLTSGDIYTFRTQSGKLGIFRVDAVEGSNEGTLTVSIKTQK